MKKSELKDLIRECVNEVEEQRGAEKILQEDFNRDVLALEQQQVLCEGLVNKGLLTEEQVDEAFFDTIKNLGKNAVASVAASWKKAKAQGDKDEMARLEKKLAALKNKSGASTPTKTNREKTGNNISAKKAGNKKKVVAAIGEKVMDAVEHSDPKAAQTIKKAGPKKIAAALQNPVVKKKTEQIKKEIAAEEPAPGQQGFMGKLTSWMKKNPVKGAAAIALFGVVATAAAVGSGGILPLIGTMLVAGGKGAALGAAIGGTVRGGLALGQGKGLAAAAKEFGKGGWQGAKSGFIGGAMGGFLGSAFHGFSQGFQHLMSAGSGTVSAKELQAAQQTLDAKAEEIPKSNDIPQQQKSALEDQMDRMESELLAKGKALESLGLSKAQVYGMNDGNFKVVGADGVEHIFNKTGAEITDSATLDQLNAAEPSVAQRQAWANQMRGTVNRNQTVSPDAPNF